MTEQEISYYEKILEKIEDVRKDVRGNFLKMLSIMLGAFALILTGGGVSMNAMLSQAESNQKEIIDIKVEQGIKKERDRFIEKTQETVIAKLAAACSKKKYVCEEE
jgi:hypothetical protein